MRILHQLPSDAGQGPLSGAPATGNGEERGGGSDNKVIIIVCSLVAFIIVKTAIIGFFYFRYKRRSKARKRFLQTRNSAGLHHYTVEALKMWGWGLEKDEVRLATRKDGSIWELGQGSYGRVVLGVRNEVQPVAIKMLTRSNDPKAREAFQREVEMLKFMSLDKHIVQFYGACTLEDGEVWLVTEYMEGGELRHALTRDVPPPVTWWNGGKAIALDVVRCLAFLHSHNIIHRDLKSSNILLTREGMAKVGDAGLAKLMSDTHLTSDSAVGTFAFMAPEVLLGERCTEKVDIYAFGVVLWELGTGSLPLRGAMHLPLEPREGPPELSAIIEACMLRNPDKRPTAPELYRSIEACPPSNIKKVDMLLDSDETLLDTLPTSSDGQHGSADDAHGSSVDTRGSSDRTSGVTLIPCARWSPHMAHADHDYYLGTQSV